MVYRNLGAADYIAIAQTYSTLFLTAVPQLSLRQRDKARRFITLIDQLYNHRSLLVASRGGTRCVFALRNEAAVPAGRCTRVLHVQEVRRNPENTEKIMRTTAVPV